MANLYQYGLLKQYDKALADYNKIIELEPDFIYVYMWRGDLYEKLKRYDKAIEDYTKAIEMDLSAFKYVWYEYRGRCYQAIGEYEKSRLDFAKGKKWHDILGEMINE